MDSVTTANGFAYFETNTSGFTIAREPVGGGTSTTIFSNSADNGKSVGGKLAVNSLNGDVYYACSDGVIKRWSSGSGTVGTIYTPNGSTVNTVSFITLDATNGYIYFTGGGNGSTTGYLRRIATDGSGDTLLASLGTNSSRGIALDLTDSKIFLSSQNNLGTSQMIDTFSLDGANKTNLITGSTFYSNGGIAVNPSNGSLYLATLTGTIYRGGLDGSGLTAIYTNSAMTSGYLAVSQSAIPEPSTYAAIAGLGVLGMAVWQRRRGRSSLG